MKNLAKFFYQLFFTRDDDLDILQVLFAGIIIVTLMIAVHIFRVGATQPTVQIEALVTLRWLVALLVVTAVPKWLVPFMINSKSKMPAPQTPPEVTPDESTES